jgi:type III pantothenate kinase
MNVNLIAINIGNTRTRVGTFVAGKLEFSQALENADLQEQLPPLLTRGWDLIESADGATVVLASVNPAGEKQVRELVRQTLAGAPLQRVERDLPIPIGRQLDPESIVGDDRLLNAAAVYDQAKQAAIIIDIGTAITVDFVDGAGTFHGGAIGPGARMMLQSMHEHTAQLPEVSFQKPREPIGHNTAEAMRVAVYHGLRGMVRELAEQYATVIGSFPLIVATGGDAEQILGDYDLIERIVPDLALLGMAATLQTALDNADQQ